MKFSLHKLQIIILCIACYSPIFSQTKLGFKQIESGQLDQAIEAFNLDLDDSKMSAFAHYGKALIYMDTSFSQNNIDSAWVYWNAFDKIYNTINTKKREKYKKAFKIKSLPIKNKISEKAAALAEEKNTIKSLEHFLDFYKNSRLQYKNQITLKRNQLAYDLAMEANKAVEFKYFLKKYEQSLRTKSEDLWREGQMRFFELAMKENGWGSFDAFDEKYPRNPYMMDKAGYSYKIIHDLKDKDKYKAFLSDSPNSLFTKFAADQLVKLLIQSGTLAEFNWFLLSFPNHDVSDEVWKNFLFLYKGKHGKAGVAKFAELYPQYPFPDDIKNEIGTIQQSAEKDAYVLIEYSTNALEMLNFLSQYPNSEFEDIVIKAVEEFIQTKPTIYVYEKFLGLNPSTPLKDTLTEELFEMYTYNLGYEGLNEFLKNYGNTYKDTTKINRSLDLAKRKIELLSDGYDKKQADQFDQFIKKTAPHRAAYDVLSEVIKKDIRLKNWTTARITVEKYLPYFNDESIPYTQLLNTLKAPYQKVSLKKLNASINTEGSEFAPTISADGNTLYFSAKDREDNLGNEDIFISYKRGSHWSKAKLMQGINTSKSNEAPEAISVDGTQMMMFRSGKLCFTNQSIEGWSRVKYLPETINATSWQADASISSDGKAMLFSSCRDDIVGFKNQNNNKDLYICLKNETGEWDKVINLGNQINTPYVDRSPFLHPDMKTLYFSSAGHGGLGKADVYKSTRLDDSWLNWSTPINLGKEINTQGKDWGYKVSTDGKIAYFSFAPSGSQNEDIYQVDLPEAMRPQQVSTIAGIIKDSNGNPIGAEIIIEDLDSREIVTELKSNPRTGEFFVVLPDHRKYSYYIQKENYFPIGNNIDLSSNQRVELNEDLKLYTVAELTSKGMNFTLENIFFDHNKFDLKPESFPELNRIFSVISANNLKVELFGHTDSDGSDKYNAQLSQNRAEAVRKYLIGKGVTSSNISATGFGESKPLVPNDTKDGKSKNRRVEIRFSY